ncbi:MAG: DUF992 domain-containing protein [Pseudolabrys sp.]|nr:DUF992 domain-containing protein [Pseudolabrys sp.]MDP2297053.1 DUF992 domain-containing protein [Pseudolabrys sp.]
MRKPLGAFAVLAVAAAVALPASVMAQQPNRTKVGTLTCDVSGGIGMIVASKKAVTCLFTPANAGPREVYTGSITKFGLDVGATSGGEMVWTVFAPTNKKFGALAGQYGGASAEATVGAGLGANVLVGGSERTVSLQPVSVTGQAGLNLAIGVAALALQPAR